MKQLPQLLARAALGIGFLLPVLDRLGFMGTSGSVVNWGDWSHYLNYAQTIMSFLPHELSDFAALLATVFEAWFGLALIAGYRVRSTAIGSALLLSTFALCMIITGGIIAPFKYPVFVFIGAALLLAEVTNPKWSIDDLMRQDE